MWRLKVGLGHYMLWPYGDSGVCVRCPWCGHDEDKVVDSRASEGGSAIRRRRQCLFCGRRFTTFERLEEVGLTVVKRDGTKEPYLREKLVAGMEKALKNRPVPDEDVASAAANVERRIRGKGPQVTSERVGRGEILFLADASPLENDYLGRADDAAFALGLALEKDFQPLRGREDFQRLFKP